MRRPTLSSAGDHSIGGCQGAGRLPNLLPARVLTRARPQQTRSAPVVNNQPGNYWTGALGAGDEIYLPASNVPPNADRYEHAIPRERRREVETKSALTNLHSSRHPYLCQS